MLDLKKHPLWLSILFVALLATAVAAQTPIGQMIEPPSGSSTPVESESASPRVLTSSYSVFLPLIIQPDDSSTLNMNDRASVVAYYNNHYLTSSTSDSEMGWSGNVGGCSAGTTSQAYRDKVLARLNYFRAMAGVENDVIFTDALNAKAQAAALMMSAEDDLSHSPGTGWACYSATGADGAASSNLYLGRNGADAITGYIQDPGNGNEPVGHRRWILFPWRNEMGTGDIPSGSGHNRANALAVFGSNNDTTRNARDTFVAWPPPGYVPYQVVFARWSLSYDGVDFSNATVTMTVDGVGQAVTVETRDNGVGFGFGEHSIVWRMSSMSSFDTWPAPSSDSTVNIKIENAIVNGSPQTFDYNVIVINP